MKLGKVGRCIYCGSETPPLTDEHIIPLGLNGHWILVKASCNKCAAITSKFEMDILRPALGEVRFGLDLPTRRPKERPDKLPLTVKINGNYKQIQLPPEEYPTRLILLEFSPPAFFDKQTSLKGISHHATWDGQISGLTIEKLEEKYGVQETKQSIKWRPDSFTRLLAKIAYGFTVVCFGYENIEENYVLPYIMGEKFDGISNWVGGAEGIILETKGENSLRETFYGIRGCVGEAEEIQIVDEKSPHEVNVFVSDKMEVLVRMKLFARFGSPEYLVVVGRLKNIFHR